MADWLEAHGLSPSEILCFRHGRDAALTWGGPQCLRRTEEVCQKENEVRDGENPEDPLVASPLSHKAHQKRTARSTDIPGGFPGTGLDASLMLEVQFRDHDTTEGSRWCGEERSHATSGHLLTERFAVNRAHIRTRRNQDRDEERWPATDGIHDGQPEPRSNAVHGDLETEGQQKSHNACPPQALTMLEVMYVAVETGLSYTLARIGTTGNSPEEIRVAMNP